MQKQDKDKAEHSARKSVESGFKLLFKNDEKYYFQFNDSEGEPLLFSKGYEDIEECKQGIETVIRAVAKKERFDVRETKKGKYYFTLKFSNKVIGRSRMFNTKSALKPYLEELQGIDKQVSIHELHESENIAEEKTKNEKATDEKVGKEKTKDKKHVKIQDKQSQPSAEVEKNARYKFSIIYYPDSKVWIIKNDFSGDSTKIPTCDGSRIEEFINRQVPGERALSSEEESQKQIPPKKPESNPTPPKITVQTVEMVMRNRQGEDIHGFAKIGELGKIELITGAALMKSQKQVSCEVQVFAKCLEDNRSTLVGSSKEDISEAGKLEVPILNPNVFKKGTYKITADVQTTSKDNEAVYYRGKRSLVIT